MDDQPFLSIAIATYNRAARLEETLAALFEEIAALGEDATKVEVVVCSNASTDQTDDLMHHLCAEHQTLHYFVNDRNYGIDENIRRVAKHSKGKFIRFMSDDDAILPSSIKRLYWNLYRHQEIGFLLLNAAELVEKNGKTGIGAPVIEDDGKPSLSRLDPNAFIEKIGVWITFITAFVVRRDLWVNETDDSAYVGTDIFLSYKAIDAVCTDGGGTFDSAVSIGVRPHFSGSYRIFKAFASELRLLYLNHAVRCGMDSVRMRKVLIACFKNDLLPRIGRARLNGTFKAEERKLVLKASRDLGGVFWRIYFACIVPLGVMKIAKAIRKAVFRNRINAGNFTALSVRNS